MQRTTRDENIFYAYRGAADDDAARERQLEDNVTKAFIGTLRHTAPEVAHRVIAALVPGQSTEGAFRYALQNNVPPGFRPSRRARRVVLGIVSPTVANPASMINGSRNSTTGARRPDAWIWSDDLVILLEAKVGDGRLDAEQWAGHRQRLTSDGHEPDDAHRTWGEVHAAFVAARSGVPDGTRDAWLIDQFLGYLEVTGMAGFSGFSDDFFDLFYRRTLDGDDRDLIRTTLTSLAVEFERGLAKVDPFYERAYVTGRIVPATPAWIAFGPARDYKNLAHQTFTVGVDGVALFINVELKPAIDRLREAITRDTAGFCARLVAVGAEDALVTVEVKERVQRQVQLYDYHSLVRIDMRTLTNPRLQGASFDYLLRALSEIPLPNLEIRTRIDRERTVELSTADNGKPLVDELMARMHRFHPLVSFFNAR